MRTTLTLEPDVAALLKAAMKESGLSMKEQINVALRAGLAAKPRRKPRRPVTRTFDGGRALIDFTSTSQALAVVEGESFR